MNYFNLEPDVAGGFGPDSIVHEVQGVGLIVEKLHYIIEGWFGDEILQSCPCYIVTEHLAGKIMEAGLTGASFDSVEIGRSDILEELHPDMVLPPFVWLKITGKDGQDDFFFAGYARLVVSERAWSIIKPYAPNAKVSEFSG